MKIKTLLSILTNKDDMTTVYVKIHERVKRAGLRNAKSTCVHSRDRFGTLFHMGCVPIGLADSTGDIFTLIVNPIILCQEEEFDPALIQFLFTHHLHNSISYGYLNSIEKNLKAFYPKFAEMLHGVGISKTRAEEIIRNMYQNLFMNSEVREIRVDYTVSPYGASLYSSITLVVEEEGFQFVDEICIRETEIYTKAECDDGEIEYRTSGHLNSSHYQKLESDISEMMPAMLHFAKVTEDEKRKILEAWDNC